MKTSSTIVTRNISDLAVGAVVRYPSRNKPYVVGAIEERKGKVSVLLISSTQQFWATKLDQQVVTIRTGKGFLGSYGSKKLDWLAAFASGYMKGQA